MARGSGNCRFSALVLALVACPVALMAQSNTTAALSGICQDTSGRPVVGALVRITSPSLIGGERVNRTAENGIYRFGSLPPGLYKIVVEAAGMSTLTGSQVLELGRTTSVNWKLQAAAAATIEVISTGDTVDAAPSSTTVNFRGDDLEKLALRRDLTSIANLTPGVNNGAAWGGDRSNSNAYLLDGINVGDPSTGQQWIQVNPDWFEEVQIGGLGAAAEYGGFSGGYFNAIVKKGGNEVKGNFTAYYQSESWSAVKFIPDPDVTGQSLKVQASKNTDYSASIGGPILKDKVWFFVSAESITNTAFPVGSPVPEERKTDRFLGNVTWQVTPTGTLSAFMDLDNVNTEHRGASRIRTAAATTKQESPNLTYGLSWLQTIGSNMSLTVRASGYTGKDDRKAYNGEKAPLYVDGGVPFTPAYQGLGGYWELDNAYQVQENKRSRAGILATLDIFQSSLLSAGDQHAFKIGIERESAKDVEKTRFPGGISYNAFTDTDNVVYTDFVQVGGGLNLDTKLDRTALFFQDNWTVNDYISFNPGARVERFEGGDLWSNTAVAPRVGLVWTLDKAKTSAIKLHWGKYYDGLSAAYFDRAVPGAYPLETTYYYGNTFGDSVPMTAAQLLNPASLAYDPTFVRATRSEASRINPNAKQPYTDEWLLAYDQKLGKAWTLGLSYVNRKGKDLLIRQDVKPLLATTTSVVNPLTNATLVFNRPNPVHDYYITNEGAAKRDYSAFTVTLNGNPTKAWDVNVSYTKAELKGNLAKSNGYDSRFEWYGLSYNADGKLAGFSDDEFKFRTSYSTPWGMLLSVNFTYLSGEHFTRNIRTPRLGNREQFLIYVEPLGSQTYSPRRLLNFKVSQKFSLTKRLRLDIFGDVFNVLNSDSVLSQGTRFGSNLLGQPLSIEEPRTVRLGARFSF